MSKDSIGLSVFGNVRFRVERLTVRAMIAVGNAVLDVLRFFLFRKTANSSKRIIVFRAGLSGALCINTSLWKTGEIYRG